MPLRLQTAAGIDWYLAIESGTPCFGETTLAVVEEPERLGREYLCAGESVVDFGEVDIIGGAIGLGVGGCGRVAGRLGRSDALSAAGTIPVAWLIPITSTGESNESATSGLTSRTALVLSKTGQRLYRPNRLRGRIVRDADNSREG